MQRLYLFPPLLMHLFTVTLRTAVVAALVLLGACSKDTAPTPDALADASAPAANDPNARTYGAAWKADTRSFTATSSSQAVSGGVLTITAVAATSSTESFTVTLTVPAAVGTYAVSNMGNSANYKTILGSGTTNYSASGAVSGSTGTVTITAFTPTYLEGKFNFKGIVPTNTATTRTLTDGTFVIKR